MAKTNMLTMRVNDELLAKLNACEGESMAAKFENLVYQCCDELPKVKEQCKQEKSRLEKLRNQCREVFQLLTDVNQLKTYQHHMYSAYQSFESSMKKLTESTDKLIDGKQL